MFKSNRSLVISTLLTGTAVATGTLIYGIYQGDEELGILDDTLPPVVGNGVLPPPATYVMTTPPPVEIPGIRRLKIVRPALANPAVEGSDAGVPANGTTAEQASEYYLTGTRSADLIRSPVEARIETFPTVTLEEAVEGALAVDEWGFQVVQSYLNQAMGDDEALKARMEALLQKIEEAAGDYDLATISDAANLIIEAGARTHWTAFMAPFVLDENFKLTDGAMGWDLGPSSREPYEKFTRVGADSKMLVGEGMEDEGADAGPSIISNGVRNVEQFVASNIPNGRYRVVILTAPRPNGRSPLYPFGVDVKRNGGNVNVVDTRATDDLVPVMKLSSTGPGRLSDAPSEKAPESSDDAASNLNEFEFELSASAGGLLTSIKRDSLPQGASTLPLGGGLFASFGSSVFSVAGQKSLDDFAPFMQAEGGGGAGSNSGYMLVTRAEVVDGTLRISFRQLGGQDTYVTAVIIYPEPGNEIEEELAEEIAEFIERIAPAAGQNISVESVLGIETPIIDPVAVFADNSNGLPTQESQSATPTPQTSTPEPEPEPDSDPEPQPTPEPTPEDPVPTPDDLIPEPTSPPTTAPPTTAPPTTAPPTTAPPTTAPPTTTPPTTEPPTTTAPPTTAPPTTEPPTTTAPPTTAPPTTAPPTTAPPTTAPPTTAPPTTAPPTTAPPTTAPPTTAPPTTPAPTPEPEPAEWHLVAEAGTYDTIMLGEDFTLDGCGTTFEAELYCQLTDFEDFDLVWMYGDVELGRGQTLPLTTGTGIFGAVGNYEVTLRFFYDGRLLENGDVLTVPGGTISNWYAPGDLIFTSLDTAIIRIISVPEPMGLLLLAPGLVYVARREKKKRQERQAKKPS